MAQNYINSSKQAVTDIISPPESETDAHAINSYAYFTKNNSDHSPVKPKDELNAPIKDQPNPDGWTSYNKDDTYYRINDGRDKIAIIFNHYSFDSNDGETTPKQRKGTEMDCERLNKCLTDKLGFKTTVYEDPELLTIRTTINEVSKKSASEVSCIIVVVMTHGNANGVLRANNLQYPKSMLFEPFLHKKTKLVGVPKLFFIQACRGTVLDEGRTEVDGASQYEYQSKFPTHADFLTMYATQEGFASARDSIGSWFIQALCDQLEGELDRWDLLQHLTLVNGNIARNYASYSKKPELNDKKQMPQIESTLTRLLKFS